jgi:hypothetical protein
MINPTSKVDRLPHLIAYGEAYKIADGNIAAMHAADVAYYTAETAADAAGRTCRAQSLSTLRTE